MKKKMNFLLATVFCLCISSLAFSQNDHSIPAWVSEDGYWVMEGNVHQPRQHTVRFYTNDHILVGSASIDSKKLNVKRKRVKMQLKEMLEASLLAWSEKKAADTMQSVVSHP
ncbi:MAG TPA: hypothetical protein VL307_02775 [Chitinophagaceae bacterium]|nr:hypothetical protein [Chitinophagaceae bacterium]